MNPDDLKNYTRFSQSEYDRKLDEERRRRDHDLRVRMIDHNRNIQKSPDIEQARAASFQDAKSVLTFWHVSEAEQDVLKDNVVEAASQIANA